MAGGHRLPQGTKTNRSGKSGRRRGSHRARTGRPEPYAWLGASAVTLGLGVALASGSGVAYADDGSPASDSSQSTSAGQDSPGTAGQPSTAGPQATPKSEDRTTVGEETDTEATDGPGTKKSARSAHTRDVGSVRQKRASAASTGSESAAPPETSGTGTVERGREVSDPGAETTTTTPEVSATSRGATFSAASSSLAGANQVSNLAAAADPAPPVPKAIAIPVLKFVGGILNLFGVNTNSPLPQLDLGLAAAWTWFRQLQTEWGVAPPTAVVATPGEPDPETGTVIGVLNANNPSGLPLTYTVAIDPLLGDVTLGAAGAFTYTPSEAARLAAIITPLSDIFTVTVSNGIASNYALVTVPIGATAAGTPGIPAIVSQNVNTATGLVTGQVGSTGPAGHVLTYQVITPTLLGQLTFDNATGGFTYQPSALSMALAGLGLGNLTDVFTVVAKNGSLTSMPAIITVPITAGNATPGAPIQVSQSTNPATGLVTGQVGSTDPAGQQLTYHVITSTLGGTLTFDGATGEYTYQPSAVAMALASLGLGNVSDVFTVVAKNSLFTSMPTIITVPITAVDAKPSTPVTGTQTTNAITGVVTGSVISTDPAGQPLTYDVLTSTLGGTLNFNEATGTYTYTPSAAARVSSTLGVTTTDVFTVVATNGGFTSGFATITVPIAPNPAPPSTPTKTNQTVNSSNGRVTGKIVSTDPNGLPLTYTLTLGGIQGSYTVSANGDFSFTPTSAARLASWAAGGNLNDVFTVTVSNGISSSSAILTVPVSPKGPF